MSGLRITGIVAASVTLAVLQLLSRKHKLTRADRVFGNTIAVFVLCVALFPGLVAMPASLLSLQHSADARLVTLLLFVIVVLFMIVVRERGKVSVLWSRVNHLVDDFAVEEFSAKSADLAFAPIVVIMPAYNEASNIREVIHRIPPEIHGLAVSVLVVVDGCRDGTIEASEEAGALTCYARVNRGGGAALRLGYKIALGRGARYIVTLDADGQHDPGQIAELVEPLLSGNADIVQGSRRLGSAENPEAVRLAGVYVFSWILTVLTGVRITDSSNGFRAMLADVVRQLALKEDQYYSSELLIAAIRHGFRFIERPVTVRKRRAGTSNKGANIIYGWNYARVIVKSWIKYI